jgi:hypothetical protein
VNPKKKIPGRPLGKRLFGADDQSAIPIVPSSPVFMGYEGIGFRKLLDNMLGSKAVAHGETGNQRGCN